MSNPLSDDYFMIDKVLGSGAFAIVFFLVVRKQLVANTLYSV
jgi:hypothetical protein